MKLCLVILSGAADHPVDSLGEKTPLEVARLPAISELTARGRVVGVLSIPRKIPPSPESALAAFLGQDPLVAPPAAGALLAGARDLPLGPTDRVFRCDFVNIYRGSVVDPTAGRLGDKEAEVLIKTLDDALGSDLIRFLPGARWRAALAIGEGQAEETRTTSPASFLGEAMVEHMATGPGCELIRSLTDRAPELLAEHEINTVRVDLGENPANGIWIWGGGRPRPPSPRPVRSGLAVGCHPSFLGLAREAGLEVRTAKDISEIGEVAAKAVAEADMTVVHLEGSLVHSRLGEVEEKVRYLEEADEKVVRAISDGLSKAGPHRLVVAASHVASSENRRDMHGVVPAVISGPGTARYGEAPFTEEGARAADLVVERGHELLEFAARQ